MQGIPYYLVQGGSIMVQSIRTKVDRIVHRIQHDVSQLVCQGAEAIESNTDLVQYAIRGEWKFKVLLKTL